MAVVQTNIENEQKVSLPRRIATYITSMNFAKVFRRHPHPRESSSPIPKSPERPSVIPHHHQYSRPFSYHIPTAEQLTPSSLIKPSNSVPYRIGLSSDSALLTNNQTNENDEIVRLPIKNSRGQSPKNRKDRRHQSQLNANKRWLFRSMETLDGWKGKVFPQKNRPTNSSQTRSRSVENLANEDPDENIMINNKPSFIKLQRAISPNRSIEAITNRVINSIGIHRKSANSVPNIARSPALTIKKQSLFTHLTNGKIRQNNMNNNENNSSAILDFREISSLGFLHSRQRLNDENENVSLSPSENINNAVHISDDENEEVSSNLSYLANGYNHNHDGDNETGDSWDFSITWIDSLKEQHSPQRKIQFYENLIKLLEQDTLNIDELLVLRKILTKIWPIDETTSTTTLDSNNQTFSIDSKTIGTKSLHAPNKIKRRSKLTTMTHHTAQRCSAIIEQSPFIYETLHEQNSGHGTKSPTVLLSAKAKPCFIENNSNEKENSDIEQNYPQHLNPFNDDTGNLRQKTTTNTSLPSLVDIAPSEESNHNSNDSIRRYFERLTLLETIYEKLNIESNKTPLESIDHHHHQKISTQENTTQHSTQKYQPIEKRMEKKGEIIHHPNTNSLNKFREMNVDENGSISSSKSSIKRRAPTAPHLSKKPNNPTMFTLSSADLNIPHKSDQEIHIPIQLTSSDEKFSKERTTHDVAASCDDDGHIFVYDSNPNQESTVILPRKTDRIHQWLSTFETKEELSLPHNTSPKTQIKMRCIAKPIRYPSPSPQQNLSPTNTNEIIEPGRFRSCLKIHLETNESPNHRSRASSGTSKYHQRQETILDEDLTITDEEYYQQNILSPSFQRDHQSVYL